MPLNDLEAWESELSKGDVCACILECIQGVGGIRMATEEFAKGLEQACKRYGTILICDEIQCGYGRSGKFFAHQYLGIRPDIITMAKGMGNGFPIGGLLIAPHFEAVYGQLGTTFGGNHLACMAAISVLEVMKEENLIENAEVVGDYLMGRLQELALIDKQIVDVRGRGLMVGIELSCDVKPIRDRMVYHYHCFTGVSGKNILRLLPPLCITKEEVNEFITILHQALNE